MKRREIDLELVLLKRECHFQAIELKKIIDVDHDECAFEAEFADQLHRLENHPDLVKFHCPIDKVCDPIQVTARIRSRSEAAGDHE